MFDQTALSKAVQTALVAESLPLGHNNAVIATVDQTGAGVIVGVKREFNGADWEVQGLFRHEWTGENLGGAKVLVSW